MMNEELFGDVTINQSDAQHDDDFQAQTKQMRSTQVYSNDSHFKFNMKIIHLSWLQQHRPWIVPAAR